MATTELSLKKIPRIRSSLISSQIITSKETLLERLFKIYKILFTDTFSQIDLEKPFDTFRNIDIKSLFDDVKKNKITYTSIDPNNRITEEDLYRILSVFIPYTPT